jgi:hypothetical protein
LGKAYGIKGDAIGEHLQGTLGEPIGNLGNVIGKMMNICGCMLVISLVASILFFLDITILFFLPMLILSFYIVHHT